MLTVNRFKKKKNKTNGNKIKQTEKKNEIIL
jgi:hypothetical protein